MLLGLLTNLGTAGSTPALAGDDDAASWWSGVNRCAVGIAIAGAAALTSTAVQAWGMQQRDEVTPPPAMGGGVTKDPARIRLWQANDEWVPGSAPAFVDDDSGFLPRAPAVAPVVNPFADTVEVVPASTPLPVDEIHGWTAPVVIPAGPYSWQWQPNEDIIPSATPLPVDEFYWTAPQVTIVAPVVRVWQWQDERPTPATFAPPEDDSVTLQTRIDSANYVVWAESDEIVPQAAVTGGGGVTKEPARVLRWPVDDWVPAPSGSVVDEVYPWLPPLVVQTLYAQAITADDEIVSMPAEDEWQPPALRFPAVGTAFAADEEIVPQPAPTFVAEDEWTQPAPTIPGYAAQALSADDEIVPQPSAVHEDDWPLPYLAQLPYAKPAISADDETIIPAVPLPVDEVYAPDLRAWGVDLYAKAAPAVFADDDAMDWFVEPVPVVPDGGGYDDKKRRKRFLVQIGKQVFAVDSVAEAQTLMDTADAEARTAESESIAQPSAPRKIPKAKLLVPPKPVEKARANTPDAAIIARLLSERIAAYNATLAAVERAKADDDDEEALLMLL